MTKSAFRCIRYDPPTRHAGTIFFISSFKSKVWYYRLAIKKLTDYGFQVYAYDYEWRPLLDVDPDDWVKFSEHVQQDIAAKMAAEKSQHLQRRFGIIGVSIGATIALHAAKALPDIEKIMLVTSYGSMAQHVWEHPLLGEMRNRCKSLNLDFRQTCQVFGYFEPTYRLNLIGDRTILLFANKKDPIIPYANTELLINEAKKQGTRLLVKHIEAIRHSVTILKVFKRPGLWISFFTTLRYPEYPAYSAERAVLKFNKKPYQSKRSTHVASKAHQPV